MTSLNSTFYVELKFDRLGYFFLSTFTGPLNYEHYNASECEFGDSEEEKMRPRTPLWSGYWPQKETDYSDME